jgi:hypothetical protein
MSKARQYRYDYYKVAVPADLSDDAKHLGHQAIAEAEERSKLYAMPAIWTATRIGERGGDIIFRVCRKRRNKVAVTPA